MHKKIKYDKGRQSDLVEDFKFPKVPIVNWKHKDDVYLVRWKHEDDVY